MVGDDQPRGRHAGSMAPPTQGASLPGTLHGREVLIGLAVQFVVATAIVLVLGATEQLAARRR